MAKQTKAEKKALEQLEEINKNFISTTPENRHQKFEKMRTYKRQMTEWIQNIKELNKK